jgi:hypothetical protein
VSGTAPIIDNNIRRHRVFLQRTVSSVRDTSDSNHHSSPVSGYNWFVPNHASSSMALFRSHTLWHRAVVSHLSDSYHHIFPLYRATIGGTGVAIDQELFPYPARQEGRRSVVPYHTSGSWRRQTRSAQFRSTLCGHRPVVSRLIVR